MSKIESSSSKSVNSSGTAARERFDSVAVEVMVGGKWMSAGGFGDESKPADAVFDSHWTDGETPSLKLKRKDGASFTAGRVRLVLSIPLLNFARVLPPDCGRHYVNMNKSLDIRAGKFKVTGPNAGHPFLALMDDAGKFLYGFGLLSAKGEVDSKRLLPRIGNRFALLGGDHLLSLQFEWSGPAEAVKELSVDLFSTREQKSWFHGLKRYTGLIKERENIRYPRNAMAFEPTWCTWTSFFSKEMTEQKILDNAKFCKELGIGSIILDDGWFGPGLDDDVSGDLNIGVYEPDPVKLPDLVGLTKKVQAMGVKVLLWHAPLCVAKTSPVYEKLKKYMMIKDGKEYTSVNGLQQLCPACPEVREYVARETERMMKEYGCDGFKVDLYNCLPETACESKEHTHDCTDAVEAVRKCQEAQWKAAIAIKPDALFELKQDYGNVRFIQNGTMVRAGDTAYDVDTNAWRCFYPQAYAPCVHNDYMVTSVYAQPQTLARMMVREVSGGVPTFGMDFPKYSKEQVGAIAAWLKFYNTNRPIFEAPREPQGPDMMVWQGGTKEKMWVSVLMTAREASIPAAKKVFVLNGTGEEQIYLKLEKPIKAKWTVYDYMHKRTGESSGELKDGMRLSVPSGGMAEMQIG